MEHNTPQEHDINLPDFSEDRSVMLRQLKDLADQRVQNDVWYKIEWLGNEAARTVSSLLDAGMYYEEGAKARGETPMKFLDFIKKELDRMIQEIESVESLAMQVPQAVTQEHDTSVLARQTPSEVNRLIRKSLGRMAGSRRGRQWSNKHNRPRRR